MEMRTRAERTGYRETSRHADVMAFIAGLQSRRDPRLVVTSFGASPEGRELPLLILSSKGLSTPDQAHKCGLPVILVINGIHAGEVEGKEASQMLARDILDGKHGDLLAKMVLVIVPLFNPDGNDRIDPENRKLNLAKFEGQIGPATGVGTRVNASGINLNRDYMRQDGAEMRLLQTRVCHPWQPHLTIDCHSTNGSVHRYALTYDIPHALESARPEPVLYMREKLLPVVRNRLRERTGLETFWYGNFVADEGGTGEGWMTYPHHPRFGSNYRGLTARLDLLLETYSYLSFPERVRTTYEFLVEVFRYAAEKGSEMMEVVEASQRPPDRIAVRYDLQTFPGSVEILTRDPYTLEGSPTTTTVPHLARFVGTEVVDRPLAYLVPPEVATWLEGHGLVVSNLPGEKRAQVEVATVEGVEDEGSRTILEASSGEVEMRARYATSVRRIPAGSRLVFTSQPRGSIAVYACEARSDDGALACGRIARPAPGEEFPLIRVLRFL